MLSLPALRPYLLNILTWGFFLSGLFFPVMISIKNIFLYTSLALSLLVVLWENVLKNLRKEPFVLANLALFILLALGTIRSLAGYPRAFSVLAKYRCLLYPIILFPLFKAYPTLASSFIKGLFYSILLLLGITLYVFLKQLFFKVVPNRYPTFIYINPIYGSFVTALIAHLALIYSFFKNKNHKEKLGYAFISFFASCIILFFQEQRTGYFASFFCFLCFFLNLYPRIKFVYRLSLLLLCIPLIFFLPKIKNLNYRTEACVIQVLCYAYSQTIAIQHPESLELLNYTSSLVPKDHYLEFIEKEISLIQKKPLIPVYNTLFIRALYYKIKSHFFYHNTTPVPFKSKGRPITRKQFPIFPFASNSVGERLDFWVEASPFIAQKPWFGWGTGSFASLWVKENLLYLSHPASFQSPRGAPNPHNQFLMFLVETGYIGLGLFLVWLFSFLRSMWKKGWPYGSIGLAYVGAFMIGCWGDSLLFLNVTGNFFVILCSCLLTFPKNYFQEAFSRKTY